MNKINEMTNAEFMQELMEGYSKYGAMAQMVVMDCVQRGINDYIDNKEQILETYNKNKKDGKVSFVNMEAWVGCCEELNQRLKEKYT